MRLAIVNLTGGGLSGGYRKYLTRILPLIHKDSRVRHMRVFLPPSVNLKSELDPELFFSWPAGNGAHSWLRSMLGKGEFDVILIPTARRWSLPGIPLVAMVRNMEPLVSPFGGNPMLECIKNIFRAREIKRTCAESDRIIAVSDYVKESLVGKGLVCPEKVGVVYHGVEGNMVPQKQPISLGEIAKKRFLLTAGSIRPARGLEDLFEALALLRAKGHGFPLMIAGQVDPGMEFYRRKVSKIAIKGRFVSDVYWAGKLDSEEMSWCYHHCALFVMTSRAEACPNIALEAMAHGCQIISTCQPPMPEFFGECAIYYAAKNPVDLALKIGGAFESIPSERMMRNQASLARGAKFSWNLTAQQTVDELERVISKSPNGEGLDRMGAWQSWHC